MINIIDISLECSDYGLVNLFVIAKKFFTVLQIIVPIIAILFLAVNVIKMVMNPDEKKNMKAFYNWLIAFVIIFFLPTIVNTTMGLLGENYSISSCWNNAESLYKGGESTYNDGNDGKKEPIIETDKYK